MTAGTIIDDLGGTTAVAALLSLHKSTVAHWRHRGIPPGQWSKVVRLARRKRLSITFEALASIPAEARA